MVVVATGCVILFFKNKAMKRGLTRDLYTCLFWYEVVEIVFRWIFALLKLLLFYLCWRYLTQFYNQMETLISKNCSDPLANASLRANGETIISAGVKDGFLVYYSLFHLALVAASTYPYLRFWKWRFDYYRQSDD